MPDLILNNVGSAGPLYGRAVFESNYGPVASRQGWVGTIRVIEPHKEVGVFRVSPDILINAEQAGLLLKWLLDRFSPDLLRYGFAYPPGAKSTEINMGLFYLQSEIERLKNGFTDEELEQERRSARGMMVREVCPSWVDRTPDGAYREADVPPVRFAAEDGPAMPHP